MTGDASDGEFAEPFSRSVAHLTASGSQNPVRYMNCWTRMRDTPEQRAVRAAVNARLNDLQREIAALISSGPPLKRSVGRMLLNKAVAKFESSKLKPGEVAGWQAAS